MPEVSVEEKTCSKCGAEVRHDTQFCYNCGESVGEEAIPSPDDASLKTDAPLTASIPSVVDNAQTNGQFSPAVDDQELTSAASLRRKGRAPQRKTTEVLWEPSGNRVNLPLIISTIVFAVFTVVVILLALSSR